MDENKENKNKLYLAHPIRSRQYARKWELMIEEKYGIELANPFYDRKGEGGREDIEVMDKGLEPEKGEDYEFNLVQKDIQLIGQCQGVVAIVDGKLSYGTIMEIVYANVLKKPVFLICTNRQHDHPWLFYHAKEIYTSFEDFEANINSVLESLKKSPVTRFG